MSYVKNKDLDPRLSIFGLAVVSCFILLITMGIPKPLAASSQWKKTLVIGEKTIAKMEQNLEVTVAVVLSSPKVSSREISRYNSAIVGLQQSVLDRLDPLDYIVIHRFKSVPGLALRVKSAGALYYLASMPEIQRIDLDVGGRGGLDQSRPWINADQAHSDGFTGWGRTVAVLDSGIDSDHPDLMDALVYEHCYCYNPDGHGCPDGNSEQDGSGSAEDDHGHGTHVTGIITGNGNIAPLGIAPDTKIVAVKMLDKNNSFYSSSDIVAALDWIYNNRPDVDVVNMSLYTYDKFSGYCDETYAWTINLATAINNLRSIGILCISIAGNDSLAGKMTAPGCISSVIAVGATYDNQDSVANFSNSDEPLDIFAPGVSINSTAMGGGSTTFSGTSMAAPHVTAATAMLRQKNPNLLPSEMELALETSPVSITDPNGITRPRLDVVAALAEVEYGMTISGQVTLSEGTVNAADDTLTLNDYGSDTLSPETIGNYSLSVLNGDDYTVTPGIKDKRLDPLSELIITSSQKGKLTIAGGLSGVVMTGLPDNPTTDASGNYNDNVMYGWSGTVTPTKTGYTFSPPSRSYPNITSNQINQGYTASFTQYTLTIIAGTGGTTNPAPGTYAHDSGTQVSVTATPNTGYGFSNWSGDASGTSNPITITMDANKTITANFIAQYTLTIAAGAGGTTNPAPGTYAHDSGTQVSVTATPNTGYGFSNWTGDELGTATTITITMDSNKSITANFAAISSGDGNGDGKKKGCFIATAAYGSPIHPHLDVLRDFRDTYLMPTNLGRVLVDLYYKYSPYVADLIAKHKVLSIAVRINLLPLIAFSYSIVHFGPIPTTTILAFIFISLILLISFSRRKMRRIKNLSISVSRH